MNGLRAAAVALACAHLAACGQGGGRQGDGRQQGPAVPMPAAFMACASCHSVVPGGMGSGPSLAGVHGRRAGSVPGYPYSAALSASGIVWDDRTLDRWLQGPMRMVPGTRMVMGVPDPQARKAVIDYLEQLK